jgi:hypothetical protein
MHSVKWAYTDISLGTTITINTCSKSTANISVNFTGYSYVIGHTAIIMPVKVLNSKATVSWNVATVVW